MASQCIDDGSYSCTPWSKQLVKYIFRYRSKIDFCWEKLFLRSLKCGTFSSNNMFCNVWRGHLYFHRNRIEIAETSTSKQTMLYLFDIDLVISFFSANIIFEHCQNKQWGKGSTTNSMWFFSELNIEICHDNRDDIVHKLIS